MARLIAGDRANPNETRSKSLYFGNTTAVITCANNAAFQSMSAFTIEAWVNLGTTPAYLSRIADYVISANAGFNFEINTSGLNGIVQTNIGNGTSTANLETGVVQRNIWTHVAASWDGTTVRVFVDGVSQSTAALSGGNTGNSGNSLYIGNSSTGVRGFPGLIGDLRISDTARYTATFTVPSTRFEVDANTRVLFHFDEGTGTTVTDSDASIVGTLSGSPLPLWSTGNFYVAGTNSRVAV